MKRFVVDFLIVLFVLALFMSVTTGNKDSTADKQLSSFDNQISNSQSIQDGTISNPQTIEVDNDNIITKVSYKVSSGIQSIFNKGFTFVKKTIKSFLK